MVDRRLPAAEPPAARLRQPAAARRLWHPQQPAGYGSPQPQQPYGQPGMPPQMPMAAPGYGMPQPQLPQGLGVASMVLGIVSVVLFCIPWVNLICGILAVTFGAVTLKKVNEGSAGGKGMAITGLVLGIIVCAWFALWIILRVALGAAMWSAV
ncbi:hypothetical protein GCM10029992_27310 [Glycomyces albus]